MNAENCICSLKNWQRIISFAAAATLGILITVAVQKIAYKNVSRVPTPCVEKVSISNGMGSGNGIGSGGSITIEESRPATAPLRIISKPRATYTNDARQNLVAGVVRLKVMFLASGEIGSVTPVSELADGLTEQAIAAAKQIKFEPQRKDGVPQTVTKTIEYSFSIY